MARSILPGRFQDKDVTVVDVFEAVGQYELEIARWRLLHWKKSLAPDTVPAAANSPPPPWPVGENGGYRLPNGNMVPAPCKS
jgi:dihydroxy-acid dehydratase